MEVCQLERLPDAGEEPSRVEKRLAQAAKVARKVATRLAAVPERLVQLGLARASEVVAAPSPRPPPLGLAPGERVRVRPVAEIRRTLDEHRRCAGLGFMPVQERFCGSTFVVKKRIDRFFDERTRRLLKVRDVVILDGVFCEVPLEDSADYGGCDRSCFLFWKEDWLERVEGEGR